MKNIGYLILLFFISCNNHNKAKILLKQAAKIEFYSKEDREKSMDKRLILIDSAIKIDPDCFDAYYRKQFILTKKKDIDGLLSTNDKMISLRPNQPIWLIQRGLFFDIKGNSIEAQKYYDLGIKKYNELFKSDSKLKNDLNFRLEYVSAFEGKGDLKKAQTELNKMKIDFPNNEYLKILLEKYKLKTHKELIAFWKNN